MFFLSYFVLVPLLWSASMGASGGESLLRQIYDVARLIIFGSSTTFQSVPSQPSRPQQSNRPQQPSQPSKPNNGNLLDGAAMKNYVEQMHKAMSRELSEFDSNKHTKYVVESLQRDFALRDNGKIFYAQRTVDEAINSNVLAFIKDHSFATCIHKRCLSHERCSKIRESMEGNALAEINQGGTVTGRSLMTNYIRRFDQAIGTGWKEESHPNATYNTQGSSNNPPAYNPEWEAQQQQDQNPPFNPAWTAAQKKEEKQEPEPKQKKQFVDTDPICPICLSPFVGSPATDDDSDFVEKSTLRCGHTICPDCWKDQVANYGEKCPRGNNTPVDKCGHNDPEWQKRNQR